MKKKIDELNKPLVDINSPEVQKALWEIHNDSIEFRKQLRKMRNMWDREDKKNAHI